MNVTQVWKKAKIRNQYNQVLPLTQDTVWESDKNTRKHHIQESQEASPFPTGEHKSAKQTGQTQITKTKEAPLGTDTKKITGGLKQVSRYQTHPEF